MKRTVLFRFFVLLAGLITAGTAFGGEADVEFVQMVRSGNTYNVDVTVRHADEGWEHYANWWRITDEDGNEIARRELLHPHQFEQPFTRGLVAITIPEGIMVIIVEAHDMVHGYGGSTITVPLKPGKGGGYEVSEHRSE